MSKRTNRRPSILPSKDMTRKQLQRWEAYLLDARKVIVQRENDKTAPEHRMTYGDTQRAKKNGCCADCGRKHSKRSPLAYHHLRDKLFVLSIQNGRSYKERWEEVNKCIWLCKSCHVKRHEELPQRKQAKRRPKILPSKDMTMKQLQRWEAYLKDIRTHIVQRENDKTAPEEGMTGPDIRRAKRNGCCADCGRKYSKRSPLAYHHLKSEDKLYNLSQSYYRSQKENWEEFNKCILLCEHCHAERTAAQGHRVVSDAECANRSASLKIAYERPAVKARNSKARAEVNARPEVRAARSRSMKGNKRGAKVTDAQIIEIRELYASGEWTQKALEQEFGVTSICCIVNGRSFKNGSEDPPPIWPVRRIKFLRLIFSEYGPVKQLTLARKEILEAAGCENLPWVVTTECRVGWGLYDLTKMAEYETVRVEYSKKRRAARRRKKK